MLVITATDLQRFMACNGSRLIEGFKPSVIADDTDREEGNAAHWLIKEVHSGRFQALELIDRKADNGVFITEEMADNIEPFMAADPLRAGKVEIETSFAGAGWQVNARADRIRISQKQTNLQYFTTLHIDDFKYGWGIVNPDMNWTLIAHALGYCIANQFTPDYIEFTIFQPRPYSHEGKIRSWKIPYARLLELYDQINQTLMNPNTLLVTGPQCKNCPGFVNCSAVKKAQMNALDVSEMAFNDRLDNESLSAYLDTMERASEILKTALKAYKDLALHRVRAGEHVRNYSIENDLTNIQWKEHVTVELVEIMTGRNDLTKKKLITPTQAKKLGVDETTVSSMSERKNKGIKLVRVDEHKKAQKAFG